MSKLKEFVAAALLGLLVTFPAQARCPAGESGCTMDNAADKIKERVDQGAQDVQEAETVGEKVNAVKDTVKDCVNCGMDAVKEGFDKAGKFDSDE